MLDEGQQQQMREHQHQQEANRQQAEGEAEQLLRQHRQGHPTRQMNSRRNYRRNHSGESLSRSPLLPELGSSRSSCQSHRNPNNYRRTSHHQSIHRCCLHQQETECSSDPSRQQHNHPRASHQREGDDTSRRGAERKPEQH